MIYIPGQRRTSISSGVWSGMKLKLLGTKETVLLTKQLHLQQILPGLFNSGEIHDKRKSLRNAFHSSGLLRQSSTGQRICYSVGPITRLLSFKPVCCIFQSSSNSDLDTTPVNVLAEPTLDGASPHIRQCTYDGLYKLVADLVSSFVSHGLKAGDRVASYSSNCIVSASSERHNIH